MSKVCVVNYKVDGQWVKKTFTANECFGAESVAHQDRVAWEKEHKDIYNVNWKENGEWFTESFDDLMEADRFYFNRQLSSKTQDVYMTKCGLNVRF